MEKIIKVDINDNYVGEIEKLNAHTQPILHRAFSVFLYNGDKILIQRRAKNKYHSGGLWANSCCSHPRANKTFLQSVKERLKEELNIFEDIDLSEIFCFTYLTKFNDNLYEYEFDHVLVGEYKNSNINFNPEEIMDYEWITLSDLKYQLVNTPQKFASWFIICAPKVINYLQNT